MPKIPEIQFSINKYVNLYYHLSVLFSEYFPSEYADGILNNASYRQQHERLKTKSLHQKFGMLWQHSYYAWDFTGKTLFEANTFTAVTNALKKELKEQMDIWLGIFSEALTSYEKTWRQTEGKLKEYVAKFEREWNPISENVLSKMSRVAKRTWKPKIITVHFVDCIYGAQSWTADVVVPPFPDSDVEKKLLSHELAHILIPDYLLNPRLQHLSLDVSIGHTIVDLVAYFGVKEYTTDPERRGVKPNPDYYSEVPKLYPIFEDISKHPGSYTDFDEILRRIKL